MNPAEALDPVSAIAGALALWAVYLLIGRHDHAKRVRAHDLDARRARLHVLTQSSQHSRLDDPPRQAQPDTSSNDHHPHPQQPFHGRSVAR